MSNPGDAGGVARQQELLPETRDLDTATNWLLHHALALLGEEDSYSYGAPEAEAATPGARRIVVSRRQLPLGRQEQEEERQEQIEVRVTELMGDVAGNRWLNAREAQIRRTLLSAQIGRVVVLETMQTNNTWANTLQAKLDLHSQKYRSSEFGHRPNTGWIGVVLSWVGRKLHDRGIMYPGGRSTGRDAAQLGERVIGKLTEDLAAISGLPE